MKYCYKNKNYDVPDAEIDKLVNTLKISIIEAAELWLSDNGLENNEEQEELDKMARNAPRRYEQGANPRKKTEKVRKVDENKAEILNLIQKSLENHPDIVITGQKTETELYFEYDNAKYTVKLTKHRPKK